MAKTQFPTTPLSFVEIVMRADAATIKAAYEARLKVDELLAAREEAYRRIAEIEAKVEGIMGEQGVFTFPDPPMPVAGFSRPQAQKKPAAEKKPVEKKPEAPVGQ